MAEQQGNDRPAKLWLQGEEFDGYVRALGWIRTTIEALHLPRGTWYRVVEAWPTQGVVKMAAKVSGEQVEGAPPGNRRFPQTEERMREIVWHVRITNANPEMLDRIYTALSQGAAALREAQSPDGPFIWAVERAVDPGKDEEGNTVETNIIRVVVPVSRAWLDWPG